MMKLVNSSILCAVLLLSGCASAEKFNIYVDAQKSFSRDQTVTDAARIAALIELAKDSDREVKIEAIKALQQIQRSKRVIIIEQPKGLFGN
jgi:PBP1b-binding outer membrane lipoprotein LpoB